MGRQVYNAVISGRTQTAVLVAGENVYSLDADSKKLIQREASDLRELTGFPRDFEFLEDAELEQIHTHLIRACDREQALDLFLILMNPDYSDDLRIDAADDLAGLIGNEDVLIELKNILYSKPLPKESPQREEIPILNTSGTAVTELLDQFYKFQPTIQKVWMAWDQLKETSFTTNINISEIDSLLVRHGIFRKLVFKTESNQKIEFKLSPNFIWEFLKMYKYLPGLEQLIKETEKNPSPTSVSNDEINFSQHQDEIPKIEALALTLSGASGGELRPTDDNLATKLEVKDILEAGVQYGHRVSRWNPKMRPYIYGRRNQIHIIDLKETVRGILRGKRYLERVASQGSLILFVGTKKQAQGPIRDVATACGMPYVTERWLGGTLINYRTIRNRVKRLEELESLEETGEINSYSKKMQSTLMREKRKVFRNLNGIRTMNRLPEALVVIDPTKEINAVDEAHVLGIKVVGLVNTDSDPGVVDLPIPGNDYSIRSIRLVLEQLSHAIINGQSTLPNEKGHSADHNEKKRSGSK